ncbi:MAG: hypothetical protein WCP39_03820, partial [Chlamydiota bacterium]
KASINDLGKIYPVEPPKNPELSEQIKQKVLSGSTCEEISRFIKEYISKNEIDGIPLTKEGSLRYAKWDAFLEKNGGREDFFIQVLAEKKVPGDQEAAQLLYKEGKKNISGWETTVKKLSEPTDFISVMEGLKPPSSSDLTEVVVGHTNAQARWPRVLSQLQDIGIDGRAIHKGWVQLALSDLLRASK